MKIVKILMLAMLSMGIQIQAQQSTVKLDAISDVDTSALSTLPEIGWSKDPFQRTPGFAKRSELPAEKIPRLDAIIYSESNPSAILNGDVMSPGEYIYDRKLLEVGRNYVLLEEDNSIIELTLPPAKEISTQLEIKELSDEK